MALDLTIKNDQETLAFTFTTNKAKMDDILLTIAQTIQAQSGFIKREDNQMIPKAPNELTFEDIKSIINRYITDSLRTAYAQTKNNVFIRQNAESIDNQLQDLV